METNHKQRIVERIKKSTNILVTVSRDPSVDELSAALALTLMLNKMDKHATAVYSGATPPAISFLEPQKTFEHNTDSLRDFIIALDKEKADRLRYKVEDDVVRIYITPYQTTITERDFDFSQGDFNVELIIALGVKKQDDLDEAISAHGRILHDATVVTVNTDNAKGGLGSIEWNDEKASSLCEMLMSLSEALQPNLLDEQVATGLLTGIVAATNRFSNDHTSPRVMTMSAQLMAAGANQQLIADELDNASEIAPSSQSSSWQTAPSSNGGVLKEDTSHRVDRSEPVKESPQVQEPIESEQEPELEQAKPSDGALHINHDAASSQDDVSPSSALDEALASVARPVSPSLSVADLQRDIAAENESLEQASHTPNFESAALPPLPPPLPPQPAPEPPVTSQPVAPPPPAPDWRSSQASYEPSMGGTLNATADEAAEAKRRELESGRNRTILSHDAHDHDVAGGNSVNTGQPEQTSTEPTQGYQVNPTASDPMSLTKGRDLQPITMQPISSNPASLNEALAKEVAEPLEEPHLSGPSIAELQAQAHQAAQPVDQKSSSIDDARNEVSKLFDSGGYEVTPLPADSMAHPLPTAPVTESPVFAPSVEQPQPQQSMPPLPPMPDFTTLPPLPSNPSQPPHPGATPFGEPPQAPPQAPMPGQFQIPGQ